MGTAAPLQLRYREVVSIAALCSSGTTREVGTANLCSSGTGRWEEQLYEAQIQGEGHSSSMQLRYRKVGTVAVCSSGTGRWARF
jgi:hypothetical protein